MGLDTVFQLIKEERVQFKKISELVGLTEQGLRKALKNETIGAVQLKKIADYFSVDINQLLKDGGGEIDNSGVSKKVVKVGIENSKKSGMYIEQRLDYLENLLVNHIRKRGAETD